MTGTRIADLPNIEEITDDSYVIIERPGFGEGTYKGTVADLQSDLRTKVDQLTDRVSNAEEALAKVTSLLMWEGTRAQWEALSDSDKRQYKIVCIIDE